MNLGDDEYCPAYEEFAAFARFDQMCRDEENKEKKHY